MATEDEQAYIVNMLNLAEAMCLSNMESVWVTKPLTVRRDSVLPNGQLRIQFHRESRPPMYHGMLLEVVRFGEPRFMSDT